jgi:low affinity Fe/Cu permease
MRIFRLIFSRQFQVAQKLLESNATSIHALMPSDTETCFSGRRLDCSPPDLASLFQNSFPPAQASRFPPLASNLRHSVRGETLAKENPRNGGWANGFQVFATKASYVVGTKWAFAAAIALIVAWAIAGPYFRYSDTWQLVVNTATTVVTFLIVFLIQNTQNREAKATQLTLDEIIRSINPAHNEMIDIEKLSDKELERLSTQYEQIRKECEARNSERKGA